MIATTADPRVSPFVRAEGLRLARVAKLLASKVAAEERMRFALRSVRFLPIGKGRARMEATNGRILARVDFDVPSDRCQDEGGAPTLARELLVSTDTVKSLRTGEGLMIDDAGRLLRVDSSGLPVVELVTDQDGTFPDTDSVIPARTQSMDGLNCARFGFSPGDFCDLMSVADAIRNGSRGPNCAVSFSYAGGSDRSGHPLRMDAQNGTIEFVGVIMPIVLD